MKRWILVVLACVVGLMCCHGPLMAGDSSAAKRTQDGQSAKKTSERDPVEMAFRLPRGVQLSQRQQEAFGKMRSQFEPRLREALDTLADAKDERSKRVVVKQITQIRQEIREAIGQIVNSPSEARSDSRRDGESSGGSENRQSASGEVPRGYMPVRPVWGGYPYPIPRQYYLGERAEAERAAALKAAGERVVAKETPRRTVAAAIVKPKIEPARIAPKGK